MIYESLCVTMPPRQSPLCESSNRQCSSTVCIADIKRLNECFKDNPVWPPFFIICADAPCDKQQMTWSACSLLLAYYVLNMPKLHIPQIAAPELPALVEPPKSSCPKLASRKCHIGQPGTNRLNARSNVSPFTNSNRPLKKRAFAQRHYNSNSNSGSDYDSRSVSEICHPETKRLRSENLVSRRFIERRRLLPVGKETISQTVATITIDSAHQNSGHRQAIVESSFQQSLVDVGKVLHSSNQDFRTSKVINTVACSDDNPNLDYVRAEYESERYKQRLEQDADDQQSIIDCSKKRHDVHRDSDDQCDDLYSYDDEERFALDNITIRGHSPPRRRPIPVEGLNEPFVGNMSKEQFVRCCEGFLQQRIDQCPEYTLPSAKDDVSAFFGITVPSISVRNYVERLVKYAHSSNSTFVVMLIYIERIEKKEPRLQLNNHNMHRIAISALMIACKLLDDRVFSSAHYARVGGVPSAAEMITLERLIMRYIGHKLYVNDMMYNDMVNTLEKLRGNQPINNRQAP